MSVKVQCSGCGFLTELAEDNGVANCTNCRSLCNIPSTIVPGLVVDDYLVKELIGRGGKGNVYLAHELILDRDVALKVLEKNFQNDLAEKESLLKEARSVASLNHPNIVHAIKFGEYKGTLYFVMELVEGKTLKTVIKEKGIIEESNIYSIAIDIANALKHAWERCKLVHSDIKPDNIMISKDGTAKLTDLGLSQNCTDTETNQFGVISGTPQYISPEQILGEGVDVRSDMYSLGATLFHAVTGEFPFKSKDPVEMLKKHLDTPPPKAIDINPQVSQKLSDCIDRMLAKNKEDRFQTCDDLLNELYECSGQEKLDVKRKSASKDLNRTETEKAVESKNSKTLVFTVLLFVLTLGTVSAFIFGNRKQEEVQRIKPLEPVGKVKQIQPVEQEVLDSRVVSYSFVKGSDPEVLSNVTDTDQSLNGKIFGAAWVEGFSKDQQALEFKNSEDHVKITVPTALKSFTLTAWVKIYDLTNEYNSIICSDEFYRNGSLHWQIYGSGQITSAIFLEGGKANGFDFDTFLTESDLNKWKFLAVVYDSENNTYKVFIDGKYQSGKIIYNPTLVLIDKAQIGNWDKEARNFHGSIGKFEIFKKALSNKQIADLYKLDKPLEK